MDLKIKDKVALVTGSNSGIGKAIARQLAEEGARVIIHGRNEKRVHETVGQLTQDGLEAFGVIGDLGTDEEAAQVVQQVHDQVDRVDILVNNAGVYDYATWDTVTTEDWEKTLNIDVLSAVRLIQAFLPAMKEAGWGRIIQIGSGTGHQPFATIPQYGALKAAMNNMTVSLARDLGDCGVLTNVVTPGLIYSKSVETHFRNYQKEHDYDWGSSWQEIEKGVTTDYLKNDTGKLGKPADVAAVVALLASPLSSFVSGANWRVDGGSSLAIN